MPESRVTKKIFLWDREINFNNWSHDVCSRLSQIDENYIFKNNLPCDVYLCKGKLFQLEKLKWQSDIECKPKLRTYKFFKDNFCSEKYVDIN